MIYTVPEAAYKLHISKPSLYSKIKLPLYSNKIITKHGQAYIDDDLISFIKDNMKPTIKLITDKIEENQDTIAEPIEADESLVSINQELINALLDQLKEKDSQINNLTDGMHELNDRLKQEQELNKNNQVLQLRQPQDIKALESHFQDLDTKLEEVKEKMQERKQDQEPKGFLRKLFNKK